MRWKTSTLALLLLSLSISSSILAEAAPPPLPRGPELQVNSNASTFNARPSIAAFPDGSFVIVWSDGRVRARFLDPRGRLAGSDLILAAGGADQVAADRDGSFLVVWATSTVSSPARSIFVRRFNRNGTPRGQRIRVSAPASADRDNPVITIGPDSRFAVAWKADIPDPDREDAFYTNAVGRVFTARGTPLTPEITLLHGFPASPAGDDVVDAFPSSLALKPDGTLAALVQSLENSCLHSFLAQASPAGAPRPLQGLGSPLCGSGDDRAVSASLAMGLDGSLVATWSDGRVWAQRFAPQGTPRGQAFLVGEDAVGAQRDPAAALQAGGSFVIVWTEEDRDGDSRGIFGRSFAANGTPRTEDFQVNSKPEGDQFDPSIAAPRQGPLVVVWAQENEELGRTDIFARVLARQ